MRRAIQACLNNPTCRPEISCPPRATQFVSTTSLRHRSDNTLSFPGFHPDPLDAPLSTIVPQPRPPPPPPPPDDPPNPDSEAKIARARVVFGSRLAGPIERRKALDSASTNIAGVLVPPKPLEPDNCCMSGCVNCVWDLFRDDLEEWAEKSAEARGKLEGQRRRDRMMGGGMPGSVAGSVEEDGGGGKLEWGGEGVDLFEGIPVGIREFMKTEKKLKERHRREKTSGG